MHIQLFHTFLKQASRDFEESSGSNKYMSSIESTFLNPRHSNWFNHQNVTRLKMPAVVSGENSGLSWLASGRDTFLRISRINIRHLNPRLAENTTAMERVSPVDQSVRVRKISARQVMSKYTLRMVDRRRDRLCSRYDKMQRYNDAATESVEAASVVLVWSRPSMLPRTSSVSWRAKNRSATT